MSEYYTPRKESFEVVLVKPGKSGGHPDDYERVPIDAVDPLQARMDDSILTKVGEGYRVLFTSKPGMLTDPEINARANASIQTVDRSKL